MFRSFVWCLFVTALAGCGGSGGNVSPNSGNGQNFGSAPFGSAVPLSNVLKVSGTSGTVMYVNFVATGGELVSTYAGTPVGIQTPLLTDDVIDAFTATFGPSDAQVDTACAMVVMTASQAYFLGPYIRVVDVSQTPPVKVGDVDATSVPPGAYFPTCATTSRTTYTLAPGRTYGFVLTSTP